MIVSFGDAATEALFHGAGGKSIRRIPTTIRSVAFRKLDMLDAATELVDLRRHRQATAWNGYVATCAASTASGSTSSGDSSSDGSAAMHMRLRSLTITEEVPCER